MNDSPADSKEAHEPLAPEQGEQRPEPKKPRSELAMRFLTAGVALAIVLPFLFLGGVWGVVAIVTAAAALGMWEYGGMQQPPGTRTNRIFAIGLATLPIVAAPFGESLWLASLVVAALGVPAAAVIVPETDLKGARARISATLFGVVYLGFLLSYIPALRSLGLDVEPAQPYLGLCWLVVVLAAVWLGDTGAYLIGRAFGKHKLAPNVSPGKTWEGAAGGLAFSLLSGLGVYLVVRFGFGLAFPFGHTLVAAGIAGVFGQVGDLAESLLKRGAGVKDSGFLFPGHGGMLDRLDSLLFAFPAVYFYARYVAGV